MDFWTAFFKRLLSPMTARFILALMALGFASFGANKLINLQDKEAGQAAVFAVGQLFGLASLAFGYYFSSSARNDEKPMDVNVKNRQDNPVPVENTEEGK